MQVLIMKMLEHPNIVNLVEVIDDPSMDKFYMGIFFLFLFSFLPSDVLKRVIELALLLTTFAFFIIQFLNMWKAIGFVRVLVLHMVKILLESTCEI